MGCNMEIRLVDKTTVNAYIAFSDEVYKNNIFYRNTMGTVLRSILSRKAQICKSSIIKPIMVMDSEKIVAVCTFAIIDRMKDTLQIAFFEALENQESAIGMMIDFGKRMATKHGINKILVGLNLHVNYVLGILADHYESIQSFGSAYNPPYYIDYFKKYAYKEVNLVNYRIKMDDFSFDINNKILEKIKTKYHVRKADFSNLKRDSKIYTNLNNQAFKNHNFYYERRFEEDLELFNDFKILLKEENLLFMEHDRKPIGFLLWYPDYNELIGPGQRLGIKTIIKHKIFHRRIKGFKIVEIGVLPEYQKSGAVLALFQKCREIVKGRYGFCESGWILENNLDSRGFGHRWADKVYKNFKVFLINC